MLRELLRDLLGAGEYEPSSSYSAFHQPGADYVCILRDKRLTVKLYAFEPSRYRPVGDAWGRPIAVNPHTHRYPFQTVVLSGGLTNVLYRNDGWEGDHVSKNYRWSGFVSGLAGGEPKLDLGGDVRLWSNREQTLVPGQSYDCRPEEIHSVIPHPWRPTLLALFQHADETDGSTIYYQEKPQFDGLYQSLPEQRAIDIIRWARGSVSAHLPRLVAFEDPRS